VSFPELSNDARSRLSRPLKEFTPQQRFEHVTEMVDRLIDLMMPVITLHETNRIVAFSDRLSSQIPPSYAANAFIDFQGALLDAETARLVRLWDRPEWSRNSIQTAYWLTVDRDFRNLCDQHAKDVLGAMFIDTWYEDRQARSWRRLDFLAPRAFEAPIFERLENYRNKHLSHSLMQSAKEKHKVIPNATYRDHERLLARTLIILRLLNMNLRQAGFDWSNSFRIARSNAESRWNSSTFSFERGRPEPLP
jgi:hypothetical protein